MLFNCICITLNVLGFFLLLKLMYYLKNVQFVVPHTNEKFEFKDGNVDGLYDIINWQTTPTGEFTYVKVGFYNSTAPTESRMTINNASVIWNNDILEVSGEIMIIIIITFKWELPLLP